MKRPLNRPAAMGRVRRCDNRCHRARGTKCACWCHGAFHGAAGANNRAAMQAGVAGILEEHGFTKGKTAYIHQTELPIKKDTER